MASVSISCPSCSATDGVVRNGKSTAGHQRYLCSHWGACTVRIIDGM
ncbi:IS1 family transposase, partial [Escherichia coli]